MKELQISEDILPVGEFKTHASRIIRQLKDNNRPFVITQNGKPAAVLITPSEFDRLKEYAHYIDAIDQGLADSESGRVISDAEFGRELDATFGPVNK